MTDYKPQQLDRKWQHKWAASRAFEVSIAPSRPKFYCLEMFAYPSGHAHVGHVRNYIIGDVMARTKRLRGYNVLHPFGWDAFGLPAENAAIQSGIHPEESTRANIAHMKGQLQRLGISYAWEREFATCDPEYYKWNQWLFIRMFERGLAYRRRSSVNWCPKDQTVLANEQVVDGGCWRCGTPVETRDREQWFFRITPYADELLNATVGLQDSAETVLTKQPVPIWVANFVLGDYGTGAVMAVPAHDQRDFEFARKFNLPIRIVIVPEDGPAPDADTMPEAADAYGRTTDSGEFSNVPSEE